MRWEIFFVFFFMMKCNIKLSSAGHIIIMIIIVMLELNKNQRYKWLSVFCFIYSIKFQKTLQHFVLLLFQFWRKSRIDCQRVYISSTFVSNGFWICFLNLPVLINSRSNSQSRDVFCISLGHALKRKKRNV